MTHPPDRKAPLTGQDPVAAVTIQIRSKASIIHIGSLDSFDITEGGKTASRLLLTYLEKGDADCLSRAIHIYDRLIPNENFGGEYTALRWICLLLLAPPTEQQHFLDKTNVASWYNMLAKNDFANLKDYIKMKYHFVEIEKEDPVARVNLRFFEDFILFNNPDRERWDKTSENMWRLGVNKGEKILDFGSGPGYFTFKFAEMVGAEGHVYAVETNRLHIDYLEGYINEYNIQNVAVFDYQVDGIGIKPPTKVDLIYMCSLYHILYAACTDGERDLLLGSITSCLNTNGRLIIVDNDLVEDEELPYHGPYISRELIISQMRYYGLELIDQYQFTPQRYVLEFRLAPAVPAADVQVAPAVFADPASLDIIRVTSRSSLVRYRMVGTSSQGYTLAGKKAAKLFAAALEKKDKQTVQAALATYEDIIPRERIGDEYTAFQWFCQYLLADAAEQKVMLTDRLDREFFHYWGSDDFALLKKYVRIKYDLAVPNPQEADGLDEEARLRAKEVVYEYTGGEVSFDQLNEWSEFITFNNPNRESWDKTSKMLQYLNIQQGDTVADVGCGTGYYLFKFAELVGKTGKVYGTELNKSALGYVEEISRKYDLNIQTVTAKLNDCSLPADSFDTLFLCSMYHAVYIASIEFVKDEFIASLKSALKKAGRLVIVDNTIAPPDAVPYFGSGIAKELVIAQLKYYGFTLVDQQQFIPQRYVLVFKKTEAV